MEPIMAKSPEDPLEVGSTPFGLNLVVGQGNLLFCQTSAPVANRRGGQAKGVSQLSGAIGPTSSLPARKAGFAEPVSKVLTAFALRKSHVFQIPLTVSLPEWSRGWT
eukprot:1084685-Amphidinium_carterae.1